MPKIKLMLPVAMALLLAGAVFWQITKLPAQPAGVAPALLSSPAVTGDGEPEIPSAIAPPFNPPLNSARARVTKKPFGLYVTKENSPVSPERFSGYHTGVDFEILAGEENAAISIAAICAGRLILKKSAAGYGGVAVQSCQLNGQELTVVYGHLQLDSLALSVGEKISAGQSIGRLGQGYSRETDGERKHLHLGIHRGKEVNLLGYVPNIKQLDDWLDIMEYIK